MTKELKTVVQMQFSELLRKILSSANGKIYGYRVKYEHVRIISEGIFSI